MSRSAERRRPSRRARLLCGALACAALTVAACSSDGDASGARSDGETSTDAGSAPTSADDPEALTDPDEADANAVPAVRLERLDVDLDNPIAAVPSPDGASLVVAQRAGTVVQVTLDADGNATGAEPVLDITDQVGNTESERGLLGVAIDPAGDTLYVSYTRGRDGASQLVSYPLADPDGAIQVDASSPTTLLEVDQPFPNHNGGDIVFGPDGMLYMGLGDGGGADDPNGNGQDRSTLLGKLLRLDPAAADLVPADNPFVGVEGVRPEIWATGLRNPWRFSFDRSNGDLWIADVGQNEFEEVDLLPAADGGGKGANLGWDLFEGDSEFADADPAPGAASDGPFTEPVFTYTHDQGCSITGGVVYRGEAIPDLQGSYLFSDYCVPGLRALSPGADGPLTEAALGPDPTAVVSFVQDDAGEVYVISLEEGLFRLVPA